MPTNEIYTVLTDIWSSGNVPQLHRALPIVFSWWIGGISLATWGHLIRCHKAWKQDEKLEKLNQTSSLGKSEGKESSENGGTRTSGRTPSEALLEAAEEYRSTYGPSVPLPYALSRAFDIPDVVADSSEPQAQTIPGIVGSHDARMGSVPEEES